MMETIFGTDVDETEMHEMKIVVLKSEQLMIDDLDAGVGKTCGCKRS